MSRPVERTKVVVRNLPPLLTSDSFAEVLEKHAAGTYDWSSYFPGKVRCGRGTERLAAAATRTLSQLSAACPATPTPYPPPPPRGNT